MSSGLAGARRDDYFARVCNAVEYADEHLGEDLRLEVLAEVACFSPRHFHRVFTSLLGETPDDCVRRLRLQKAAGLVLRRDAPTMTEIAQDCGFSTSALFSRNFARHYGASPTEWRDGIKRQAKVKHRQVPVASGKDPLSSFRYLLGENDEEVAEVDTLKIEPLTVYCVPYLQGYNEGVGDAFSRLARWARPRGFLTKGSRIVAIPFDNPATTPSTALQELRRGNTRRGVGRRSRAWLGPRAAPRAGRGHVHQGFHERIHQEPPLLALVVPPPLPDRDTGARLRILRRQELYRVPGKGRGSRHRALPGTRRSRQTSLPRPRPRPTRAISQLEAGFSFLEEAPGRSSPKRMEHGNTR